MPWLSDELLTKLIPNYDGACEIARKTGFATLWTIRDRTPPRGPSTPSCIPLKVKETNVSQNIAWKLVMPLALCFVIRGTVGPTAIFDVIALETVIINI